MRVPRSGSAGIVLKDGKVLIAGGGTTKPYIDGTVLDTRTVEILDLKWKTSKIIARLNVSREPPQVVLIDETHAAIFGGFSAGANALKSVEILDLTEQFKSHGIPTTTIIKS